MCACGSSPTSRTAAASPASPPGRCNATRYSPPPHPTTFCWVQSSQHMTGSERLDYIRSSHNGLNTVHPPPSRFSPSVNTIIMLYALATEEALPERIGGMYVSHITLTL